MDNLFQNSLGEKSEHPAREMLLLFVDGEVAAKEATRLEAHLEACWACRVKTQKIQETIAGIIEFDEQVLTPRIIPPQGWRNFDRKLSQLVVATGKQSLSTRLFASLNRFLPSSHLFSLPRPLLTPMAIRAVVAVLMIAVILALAIRFNREPTVSANELLRNAIDAQSRQIHAVDQPVIHQKLLVRRRTEKSAAEESVSWEIWNDTKNSRVRQFISNSNQANLVAISNAPPKSQQRQTNEEQLIGDLARVLTANHMDPHQSLSAASYQAWHSTLLNAKDLVTKSQLADGNGALTLRTISGTPVNAGQIAEAQFVVTASNWQPTELRLTVAAEGGSDSYELSNTVSEVVSLARVNPAIFAGQPIVSAGLTAGTKEISKIQPSSEPLANPQPLTPAAATTDLQVEVLRLLHEARADLGEQVTATRGADGLLHITGIVDAPERKMEITRALQPVADNPAVKIEIETIAEGLAKEEQGRRAKSSPFPEQEVQINSEAIAAAPELRGHFKSDDAMREFAASMVKQSRSAMGHVYAMKRLLAQFSSEQLHGLSPESKRKWLELMRSHARAYQTDIDRLRSELQVVFSSSAVSSAQNATAIPDDTALARAIEQLFATASATDASIHAAFTTSSERSNASPISSPQFWRQMASAQALAASIGR